MNKSKVVLLIAIMLSFVSIQAHAVPITLYNTGVNDSGITLSGGANDLHYLLGNSPSVVALDNIPASWLDNSSSSKWIAPSADQHWDTSHPGGNLAGSYTYRTTFDLTGLNPDTAIITGRWSTDNHGTDIIINGHSTGYTITPDGYTKWYNFQITGYFVSGSNTLEFVVLNDTWTTGINPTGLRVEMSGIALVPEPLTISLLGLGLVGIAVLRRRLKK